jgi:aminopeptidase N
LVFCILFIRDGNWVLDYFDDTPPMSTYIVAFAVSDFPYAETLTKTGTQVRMWAPQNLFADTRYALSLAVNAMHWMDAYTDFNYSIPKIGD